MKITQKQVYEAFQIILKIKAKLAIAETDLTKTRNKQQAKIKELELKIRATERELVTTRDALELKIKATERELATAEETLAIESEKLESIVEEARDKVAGLERKYSLASARHTELEEALESGADVEDNETTEEDLSSKDIKGFPKLKYKSSRGRMVAPDKPDDEDSDFEEVEDYE
jgi:hypothetical protein